MIPVCFLLLAASIAATRAAGARRRAIAASRLRLGLVGLSVAGLIAVAIPLASAASIRDSQDAGPVGASSARRSTRRRQPRTSSRTRRRPNLQEALVSSRPDDLEAAVASAREATDDEPTNWRNWIVLSRLEARNGNVDGAIAAYRHARDLNPRSPMFSNERGEPTDVRVLPDLEDVADRPAKRPAGPPRRLPRRAPLPSCSRRSPPRRSMARGRAAPADRGPRRLGRRAAGRGRGRGRRRGPAGGLAVTAHAVALGPRPTPGRAPGCVRRRIDARMRRSERERICWTLASESPVSSAISGPVRSPPKRRAISSRSRSSSSSSAASSSGSRPRRTSQSLVACRAGRRPARPRGAAPRRPRARGGSGR